MIGGGRGEEKEKEKEKERLREVSSILLPDAVFLIAGVGAP